MCLGIPGKVIEINGFNAKADVAGTRRDVSLKLLDNVAVGDFVIVHAGFAIEKIDAQRALETLALMEGITKV